MAERSGNVSPAFVRGAVELGLVLAVVGGLGLVLHGDRPPLGDGLDGGYYLNVARHVALGHRLVTNLSIYHAGLETLPGPSVAYPLLPCVLGAVARVTALESAARAVPFCFYVTSLGLFYAWLRSSLARSLPAPRSLAPGVALAATALLGLNPVYRWASARPYTESLAFTVVFVTLLAYGRARRSPRTSALDAFSYLAVGLLSGLCYLARFQLVVVVIALAAVELCGRHGSRFRRVGWLALGAAFPLGAWALHVLRLPHARLPNLFDFSTFQTLPSLPPFDFRVPCNGPLACTLDKLGGLAAAFSPTGATSYVAQFGAAAYLVPLSLLVFPLLVGAKGLLRSARQARHAPLLASALVGALALVPIHLAHSERWYEWGFGWRQGLPLVLVLVPLLAGLLTARARRRAPKRWQTRLGVTVRPLALILLLHALFTRAGKSPPGSEDPTLAARLEGPREAAEYLERVALGGRTLGIEPQPLAAFTRAPLDWLACWSDASVAEILVRERHVTRAVLRPSELSCRSLDRIRARLKLEAIVGHRHDFGVFRIVKGDKAY